MTTSEAARLRLATLMQQVDDAEDAERKAMAAVEAARAAHEATSVAVSYVYGAVAGTTPTPTAVQVNTHEPMPRTTQREAQDTQPIPEDNPDQYRQHQAPESATMPRQSIPVVRPSQDGTAKIGAIFGAIVAILIAVNTRNWISDLADLTTGFGAWTIKAAWIVTVTAFGFFAAGAISNVVMNRSYPRQIEPRGGS